MQNAVDSPHLWQVVKDGVLLLGGLAGFASVFKVFWLDRRKQPSDIHLSNAQADLAKAEARNKDAQTVGSTIEKLEAAAVRTEALREERDKLKDELRAKNLRIEKLTAERDALEKQLGL